MSNREMAIATYNALQKRKLEKAKQRERDLKYYVLDRQRAREHRKKNHH